MNELALFAGAGGVFSVDSYLDGIRSQRANLSRTRASVCLHGNETGSLTSSQFGTMCVPSTADHGEGLSMLSAEDSPAKTLARQEKGQASRESAADCGKEIFRKRYGKRLEDFQVFLKRKYCSLSCANTTSEPTVSALRWRAEKLRKTACEVCGASLRLHAHHINGNIQDNTPENIQTLCASCHAKHHHSTRRRGLTVAGRAVFLACLMGWSVGWTDCEPLEMAKYRLWQQQHSLN